MTTQEILSAYIKPAIDNDCLIEGQKITAHRWGANSSGALTISTENNEYALMPLEILFNHVFAAAFWGTDPIDDVPIDHEQPLFSEVGVDDNYEIYASGVLPEWKARLLQLALMGPEKHYEFLTKFIEDDKSTNTRESTTKSN